MRRSDPASWLREGIGVARLSSWRTSWLSCEACPRFGRAYELVAIRLRPAGEMSFDQVRPSVSRFGATRRAQGVGGKILRGFPGQDRWEPFHAKSSKFKRKAHSGCRLACDCEHVPPIASAKRTSAHVGFVPRRGSTLRRRAFFASIRSPAPPPATQHARTEPLRSRPASCGDLNNRGLLGRMASLPTVFDAHIQNAMRFSPVSGPVLIGCV
jgi:hypothetical protein